MNRYLYIYPDFRREKNVWCIFEHFIYPICKTSPYRIFYLFLYVHSIVFLNDGYVGISCHLTSFSYLHIHLQRHTNCNIS